MAGPGRHLPRRRHHRRVGGSLGAIGGGAALQRRRSGHRRQGRPDRGRARARRRPRQPRAPRPQGPVRLAGQRLRRPAHHPDDQGARRAEAVRLGHRHAADRRPQQATARRLRPQLDRLLHVRTVVPGGLLHAGRHRARRDRHQPRRRQHPAVHRDGGRGAEGVVRLRRAAGVLHRHRPRRRHRVVRAQRRRDADGAVGADAGPAGRGLAAGDRLRRPPADAGRPARHRSPGAGAGHQRRVDERAAARDHRQRLDRPGLHRLAHGRFRRAARPGRRVRTRAGRRHLRRAGRGHPARRPAARHR